MPTECAEMTPCPFAHAHTCAGRNDNHNTTVEPYIGIAVAGLVILFIGGAFFSGVETALVALSRHTLISLQEDHPDKAPAIAKWLKDPNRILTTMLIGINVVGITSAILTENIADVLVARWHLPAWSSSLMSIGFVSIVVIEFCEIIPKILAYHNAEKYTLKLIRALIFIDWIFSPIGYALVGFGNLVIRLFGGKPGKPQGAFITEAEILRLVDRGEEQGVLEKDEREMIRNIIEFTDTQAREIMIPKPDMHIAPAHMTVAKMAQFIDEVNHSRIPVYEGNEDNITGIINSKEILKAFKEGRENLAVKEIAHKPYFVPEAKNVNDLLHEFQQKRMHMAIVLDEFGCTAGLLTIEDVLEEIVGEIRDEYDTEEVVYRWISDELIRVDGRINIYELSEVLDIDLPEDETYETLGGLVFSHLGRIPRTGDVIEMDNLVMSVEKMIGRRVQTVMIRKLPPAEESENTDSKG